MAGCLHPCPSCARHVRASEAECPFCGVALDATFVATCRHDTTRALSRAALLFAGATAIAACGGKEEPSPGNGSTSSSGAASSSSGSSSTSSSSSSSSGSSSSSSSSGAPVAHYGPAPVDAGFDADDGGGNPYDGGGVPLYGPPPFDAG